MVGCAIIVYMLICVFGFFVRSVWQFWVLAILVSTSQGGIQALSRSMFGKIIPDKKRTGEFFGFYDIFGKFSSIMGPALVGFVSAFTANKMLADQGLTADGAGAMHLPDALGLQPAFAGGVFGRAVGGGVAHHHGAARGLHHPAGAADRHAAGKEHRVGQARVGGEGKAHELRAAHADDDRTDEDQREDAADDDRLRPPAPVGPPADLYDHAWRSLDVVPRFLAGLPRHLRAGGAALVILSSDADEAGFLADAQANGLRCDIVLRRDLVYEIVTIYRLTHERNDDCSV